jgi:hypothetical protein
MTAALDTNAIGPVDVAVILFEGNRFNGDVAPALAELHDDATVRIIDLAFVRKENNGEVVIFEVGDAEVADAFEAVTGAQFELLSEDDLAEVAAGLPRDSSAIVVVWENSWAARLTAAIRGSGGQVVTMERIPREAVLRAVAALDEE